MKNIPKFSILFFLITFSNYAQDIIVFKQDLKEIQAKVDEITDTTIKYRKWDNLEGPTYNIPISSISSIKYKNGKEESFVSNPSNASGLETSSKSKINNFEPVSGYPKVPYTNIPYFLNGSEITELEKSESVSKKQHAGMWGKIYVKSIPGESSNIRISKSSPKFLIQLEDPKGNPFSICQLVPCEVKIQREFIEAKQGMHGNKKQSVIKIEFQKLNDSGLYLVNLPDKISKGEYFFTILDTAEVYAFGIDK